MSDINHLATHAEPTEGDGISYRGIVWFTVILAATTLFCQALMWGMFVFLEKQENKNDPPRAAIAQPSLTLPPGPNLLTQTEDHATSEPGNLQKFREAEDTVLHSYGWVDKDGGVVRIPIDEAKKLILERGIPGGSIAPPAKAAAPGKGPGGQ